MIKFCLLLILAMLLVPAVSAEARHVPAYLRVGLISRFGNRGSVGLSNTVIFFGHETFQSVGGFAVRPYGGSQVALYDGGQRLTVADSPVNVADAHGGMVLLDGAPYRGSVDFVRLEHGVTAVNVVAIEEYLFSVVPSEMPAAWHLEALKAQAVAARTYTFHALSREGRVHTGFDLCDRVCCQVYRGADWEHPNSTAAVMATTGLAMYFGGELIDAVYFASSGGVTENSENVWQEARPYLRSVADLHEFEPVVWTRSFSLAEISHLLTQNRQGWVGAATDVRIGGLHASGRVESLEIHGTGGQLVLRREEIRTFFSPSADGSLQSRLFSLGGAVPVPAVAAPAESFAVLGGEQSAQIHGMFAVGAAGSPVQLGASVAVHGLAVQQAVAAQPVHVPAGDRIVINGRGFGHGVGMSQRGAEGMARHGYNFRQILSHFYGGVTIE